MWTIVKLMNPQIVEGKGMEQLIVSLLLWLSLHSDFEYHPDMGTPQIKFVSQ